MDNPLQSYGEHGVESQAAWILRTLERGRPLTKLDALRLYGIGNMGARILELRLEGNDIKTEMINKTNRRGQKVRVARYFLKGKYKRRTGEE